MAPKRGGFRSDTVPGGDPTAYKDSRSSKRGWNRHKKQSSKMVEYRGVHPSMVGQLYQSYYDWRTREYTNVFVPGVPEAEIKTYTKRNLWDDRWQHDDAFRYHGHCCAEHYTERCMERNQKSRKTNWELNVDQALDQFLNADSDADTVYWDLEERQWDDFEETWNSNGEPVVFLPTPEDEISEETFNPVPEPVDPDELEYDLDFEVDSDDSTWEDEDGYEMVAVARAN